MKEVLELRVNKDFADLLFEESEGKSSGSLVRVVELSKNDARYERIPEVAREVSERYKQSFFFGWEIRRRYTKAELDSAELLHAKIKTKFEPAGEECGTVYDETNACPYCGANRTIAGALVLKRGSIPHLDVSKTIAGEVVVSERFSIACQRWSIAGVSFDKVLHDTGTSSYSSLRVAQGVELSALTLAGITPFDLSERDGEEMYRCPDGHTIGLNVLTEVHIIESHELRKCDVSASRQMVGVRRGLLQPEALLVCSPRFRSMVVEEGLTGIEFEVARVESAAPSVSKA